MTTKLIENNNYQDPGSAQYDASFETLDDVKRSWEEMKLPLTLVESLAHESTSEEETIAESQKLRDEAVIAIDRAVEVWRKKSAIRATKITGMVRNRDQIEKRNAEEVSQLRAEIKAQKDEIEKLKSEVSNTPKKIGRASDLKQLKLSENVIILPVLDEGVNKVYKLSPGDVRKLEFAKKEQISDETWVGLD